MDRKDVYKFIDLERGYQDNLESDRTDGHQHSVGEELVVLQFYLQKAFGAWVENPGDWNALRTICKVAAIAVRCMENHATLSSSLLRIGRLK